jgi:Arc/MetJ-type ribon-helix-helix transcriptional regulator
VRASDADRDAAASMLGAGCAEGMLSVETLELRLDRLLVARTREELDALVADVARPSLSERVRRAVERWRTRAGDAMVVALPDEWEADLVLGRSSRCDVVVDDPSVSRRHLEIRPTPAGGWYAVDLGSMNGTWLLGRRTARAAVSPGDELVLGHAVVRFER